MNNDYPNLIETEEPAEKNHFPIMAQLSILMVALVFMFGSVIIKTINEKTPIQISDSAPVINEDPREYPITPQRIEEVSLRADAAFVWDVKAQMPLYSENQEDQLPLASITKLMTALVAYELVEGDTENVVSVNDILQEGASGLMPGEVLSAEELSVLALISSSNDAAYALAANVGALLGDKDPTSQFIAGMNIRAEELGLDSLEFKSVTGLDLSLSQPGAVGSAKDVSLLMEHIVENHPEIVAPTQEKTSRVYNSNGAYHDADNTNRIVELIPNLIGSKTGYTDLAGGNLTIAFDAGFNRPIIITVLGSTREDRFTDVLTLVHATQETLGKQ